MSTPIIRPHPSLHHSLSLNHLPSLSLVPVAIAPARYSPRPRDIVTINFDGGAIPRRLNSSILPQEALEIVGVDEGDRTSSWKVKRKMSTPNLLRASSRRQSMDPQASHSSTRPAARTRLSLSNLITSSGLLRRLSSPPIPTSPPLHTAKRPIAATGLSPSQSGERRLPSRSSTLPSLPALSSAPMFETSWALIEDSETLTEEPIDIPYPSPISPQAHHDPAQSPSTHPHHHTNSPLNPTSPTSPQPCQSVWLCTPPKPSPSPILGGNKRRPTITTRAISTARVATTTDSDGAIIHLSSHSERVLAKSTVVQGVSCWREKYTCCPLKNKGSRAEMGLGLLRSQSAAPVLGGQIGNQRGRPGALRAGSTGHTAPAQLPTLGTMDTLGEKGVWAGESQSRDPLLEERRDVEYDDEKVVKCVGF